MDSQEIVKLIDERIAEVSSRYDSMLMDVQIQVDELCDELKTRGVARRNFYRRVSYLHGLLADIYKLSSPDDILPSRVWSDGQKAYQPLRKGFSRVSESAPRKAMFIAFYILSQHDEFSTRQVLRQHYGHSFSNVINVINQLELSPEESARRVKAERDFLDYIGRADEPVTEPDTHELLVASRLKIISFSTGRAYRRSMAGLN